jgi:hypothetical protein
VLGELAWELMKLDLETLIQVEAFVHETRMEAQRQVG